MVFSGLNWGEDMRKIESLQELAQLLAARRGYIVNLRDDRKKLHWAGCHAVEGMYTPSTQSSFSKTSKKRVNGSSPIIRWAGNLVGTVKGAYESESEPVPSKVCPAKRRTRVSETISEKKL